MIDGCEKRNRQLAFELQNSHVCEKRSNEKIFLDISLNVCLSFSQFFLLKSKSIQHKK